MFRLIKYIKYLKNNSFVFLQEVDIPICLDCYGEGTVGIDGTWTGVNMPPLNYSATDRRYWLLTVMSGFYTQKDNPILEEKLAKLYRLAFTR